jgi:CHASE3 domain sensor protein
MEDEQTHKLLQEIRDGQREHLAEYRRVTQQSLELQESAFARQQQVVAVYKRILLVGAVLVAALLGLLVYLLARWSRYLFR